MNFPLLATAGSKGSRDFPQPTCPLYPHVAWLDMRGEWSLDMIGKG